MKKYEFTGLKQEIQTPEGKEYTVHQIRALVDISIHDVYGGDIGGWIENEDSLGIYKGNAWVQPGVAVFADSRVMGDVLIRAESSSLVGDTETSFLSTVVRNSVITGSGLLEECVIDDSYIDGKDMMFLGISIDHSRLIGKILGTDGLLQRVNVEQSGDANITFIDCVICQEQGRLEIKSELSKKLYFEGVRVDFSKKDGLRKIIGAGSFREIVGEDIVDFEFYNNIELEYVLFRGECSCQVEKTSRSVKITGGRNQLVVLHNSQLRIKNATLDGNFLLIEGNVNIEESVISNAASICVSHPLPMVIRNSLMKDSARIERLLLKEASFENIFLSQDDCISI